MAAVQPRLGAKPYASKASAVQAGAKAAPAKAPGAKAVAVAPRDFTYYQVTATKQALKQIAHIAFTIFTYHARSKDYNELCLNAKLLEKDMNGKYVHEKYVLAILKGFKEAPKNITACDGKLMLGIIKDNELVKEVPTSEELGKEHGALSPEAKTFYKTVLAGVAHAFFPKDVPAIRQAFQASNFSKVLKEVCAVEDIENPSKQSLYASRIVIKQILKVVAEFFPQVNEDCPEALIKENEQKFRAWSDDKIIALF